MAKIWSERNDFAIEKFRQTGDSSWTQNLEPRRKSLEGFIPFMISDRKELVTIPQSRDSMVLGIFGSRGGGKTILSLSIAESIYHNWKCYIAFLNDMTRESYTSRWGPRQKDDKVIMHYDMFRVPKILPLVHVIPMSKNVRIPPEAVPKWKVCLTIKEVLENPEEYLGVDAAGNYLSRIKDELLRRPKISPAIIRMVLEKYDVKKNIIDALITRIQRLTDDGILSISPGNELIESEIEVKPADDSIFHKFDPLTGIMVAGGVPILHTDDIIGRKRFFVKYLTSQVEKILLNQMEHPYFTSHKKKTYIVIDELGGISSRGKGGVENPVIRRAVVQGRPMGLGVVYTTQNPSRMDPTIFSNTKYFITCQNTKTEARAITAELGLEDRYAQEITQLDKNKRECYAFTHEKFQIFDPVANETYECRDAIRGVYCFSSTNISPPRS